MCINVRGDIFACKKCKEVHFIWNNSRARCIQPITDYGLTCLTGIWWADVIAPTVGLSVSSVSLVTPFWQLWNFENGVYVMTFSELKRCCQSGVHKQVDPRRCLFLMLARVRNTTHNSFESKSCGCSRVEHAMKAMAQRVIPINWAVAHNHRRAINTKI
jgi:hypothetical protein